MKTTKAILQDLKLRWTERRVAQLIRRNTMVARARIQNLERLAQRIEDEQIPGDVVECGVYKGGTAAILARQATHSKLPRTVWLVDTFQGMPAATEADGPGAASWVGSLTSSPKRVERLLRRTGADLSGVRIGTRNVPGDISENTDKADRALEY